MKREVKALYAKAFQLAFEVAKKAERALQHELGDPSLTYIQYNYLDGNEDFWPARSCCSTSRPWRWLTTTSTSASTS